MKQDDAGIDALVSALVTGDRRAWSRFLDQWGAVIHGAVRRRLAALGASPADLAARADDAVQDALMRLCRDDFAVLRAYDSRRARFQTYIALVAESAALDHDRRQRRWELTGTAGNRSRGVPIDDVAPDRLAAPAAEADDAAPVELPPGLLSPRQQLVLRMLVDRDMDVAEVAAALGIEPQTVRSMKHKAVAKLRDHFRAGAEAAGDDRDAARRIAGEDDSQ
ncbi:MAG: sigma-70 family RNA polymerase sigma factor [Alphaproteobacteria bacterium]|nr:sigma-70 family RNA polymerase sigma factor [Alphaproteobacteria bacterium]